MTHLEVLLRGELLLVEEVVPSVRLCTQSGASGERKISKLGAHAASAEVLNAIPRMHFRLLTSTYSSISRGSNSLCWSPLVLHSREHTRVHKYLQIIKINHF